MQRRFRAHLTGALVAVSVIGLAAVGCQIPDVSCPRPVWVRTMDLAAAGSAGGATTRAELDLKQLGEPSNSLLLTYVVEVDPWPERGITAVRLRTGVPASPGDILYEFAVRGGVDRVAGTETPYRGELPADVFWDLIAQGPVYIEVVPVGDAAPIGIGPPDVQRAYDWEKSC
jgi:hypothetical protein